MKTRKMTVALLIALLLISLAIPCTAFAEAKAVGSGKEEPVGASRLNPAPVGTEMTTTFIREDVEFEVTISLNYTMRGKPAETLMKTYGIEPKYDFALFPGDDFSVSSFSIACACEDPDAPLELCHYDFDAISEQGMLYEYIFINGNRYTNPTIYSGGSCTMYVCIPVPQSEKVGIVFDDFEKETPALWFFDEEQFER